jgi:hypothetical protein
MPVTAATHCCCEVPPRRASLTWWQGYRAAGAGNGANSRSIGVDNYNFKGFGNPGGFQFVNYE